MGEAIRSVLSQDYPDFELIVVDDGSTDDSREVIGSFHDGRMKIVEKPNGGQLSAFNAGFSASEGEIICFLDADDMYQPGYLAAVAENFSRYPGCGCLLGRMEFFGARSGFDTLLPAGFLGCAPFSVATRHVWRGVSTSAISIRRGVAASFLPCPDNENGWKTRADDLLIWGTELVGADKYCFPEPTVKYRIHNSNSFFGSQLSPREYRERQAAAVRFCAWVMKKNDISFVRLAEIEKLRGNLPFSGRLRSWLKAGKSRMMPLHEYLKCGLLLLPGSSSGTPR